MADKEIYLTNRQIRWVIRLLVALVVVLALAAGYLWAAELQRRENLDGLRILNHAEDSANY